MAADTATPKSVNGTDLSSGLKKKVSKPTQTQIPSEPEEVQSNDDNNTNELADDQTEGADGTENGDAPQSEDGNGDEESEAIAAGNVDASGNVLDSSGAIIGKVNGENASQLEGSTVDQEGDVLDEEGNVIGQADPIDEARDAAAEGTSKAESAASNAKSTADKAIDNAGGDVADSSPVDVTKPELSGPFGVQDNGEITNAAGEPVGNLVDGDPKDLVGMSIKNIDDEGQLHVESGSIVGKADINPELLEKADDAGSEAKDKLGDPSQLGEDGKPLDIDEAQDKFDEAGEDVDAPEPQDLSVLKDKKVNKLGKIVDDQGTPFGILVEGEAKKLAGKKVDAEGKIWDDSGKVIGRAELLPENERESALSAPFEDFPDSVVDKSGDIIFEGRAVGKLVEGDAKKLEGKKVDADGDVVDKNGNTIGRAERIEDEQPEPEAELEKVDVSELDGKKVNKAGNVVDDNGKLFGRVVDGDVSKLVGRTCDGEGKIWSDSGKVIGTAELIPMDDRNASSGSPFEDFPEAIVEKSGKVTSEGQVVGRLIEGDAKTLAGKKVDKDGEVVDKVGNVLGKAERWEEEEEPEPEAADLSILAGKRVNKLGKVVDSNGQIFGRLVEGDAKNLAGKMCDKNGNIWNDGGVVVGKAELVPDSERSGDKEGPFSGFDNPTVNKDGKVADSKGAIIGKVIEGDAKKLYGKSVDPDGDILDGNGNSRGKAERWEEEEKEKSRHPATGRKVNKEGKVVDENGDVIAKLTEGELTHCAGQEIDADGDVVDGKGATIGHVTILADIPAPEESEPEPSETPEEAEERKQLEQDKKLAKQMAGCVTQSIDKIKPILKMITETIDAAERQPKEELDEQKLVDTVKPLLEEGGGILQEANGVIRGLDPDGRIQANAKGKSSSREATPEEYQLAEVLKELTGSVSQTIEQAKKKIAGMPHAKKELNPLWNLLAAPLGQILAAVGLLLTGVLGLVGQLLSGLGLGGLLDNLLGGLGIKGILKGLGLGSITSSLTGKK